MLESGDELYISKLEFVFLVGIVASLLLATWELGHLMADEWLKAWVDQDKFVNERIIRYGIAFLVAIPVIFVTSISSPRFGRFGATVNRAFLWYGTLLLISTIAIFVFDCLPEVVVGVIGAGVFTAAVYVLQKRFFTKERLAKIRLSKGKCPGCGALLLADALFCSNCGGEVGRKCPKCEGFTRLMDRHCSQCGNVLVSVPLE